MPEPGSDPERIPPTSSPSSADLIRRDAVHHSGLWSPSDAFVRGEDVWIIDADGRRYLDCMAGIAVASIGHSNPRLVQAVARQAGLLVTGPQNVASDVRTELMEALFAHLPAPLERVFFTSSGTEANEGALKWARAATGRRRFVAARRGFSGRTLGALAVTWEPGYREPFEPLGGEASFVPFGDTEALSDAMNDEIAAIVLEPVQGEGGVHPAPEGYLATARRLADEHGALLILDEIQSGVGRTGRFLASEHDDVVADIVTLAKGLGGGVPIGAVVMTDPVARSMPKGGHGTTFGGNPLSSAAALAVLKEIDERQLTENAARVGDAFMERLRAIASPRVVEVRGRGLLIGVETAEEVAPLLTGLKERGVLAMPAGSRTLRFVPPLTFAEEHADAAASALAAVLEDEATDEG